MSIKTSKTRVRSVITLLVAVLFLFCGSWAVSADETEYAKPLPPRLVADAELPGDLASFKMITAKYIGCPYLRMSFSVGGVQHCVFLLYEKGSNRDDAQSGVIEPIAKDVRLCVDGPEGLLEFWELKNGKLVKVWQRNGPLTMPNAA